MSPILTTSYLPPPPPSPSLTSSHSFSLIPHSWNTCMDFPLLFLLDLFFLSKYLSEALSQPTQHPQKCDSKYTRFKSAPGPLIWRRIININMHTHLCIIISFNAKMVLFLMNDCPSYWESHTHKSEKTSTSHTDEIFIHCCHPKTVMLSPSFI